MSLIKKYIYVLCLVAFMAVAAGCESEGPGEKAGKQFDEALNKAKESMQDMSDQAKEAYDQMSDQAKEAYDKAKESMEK
ncbi:YtxH domain-containing protein [Maridesulfovibrio hydrothermalis]|uniref:Lipoprotein n=1 Tax=Maridesulfovibrio hydrothermalis AM13 = DSM 14728 TaxID=1121451 RepID=L0R8S6_9BACT|nr:YtxH domain-containing protein [Maridesulfovibrio hydrothermalis]CCO23168.1 conserved exported protein of unknown function [Maridesulfovibrio hydrothermalis AM13 = DSM 14728]